MRMLFIFGFVAFAFIPSCQLGADPEPYQQESAVFQSDKEDCVHNGQRYYARGLYRRALDQYRKLLELDPNSWVGNMGAALCHYQLGKQQGGAGRLKEAHARFQKASEIYTRIWDGSVEASTQTEGARQFKVCMSLAENQRAMGYLDTLRLNQLEALLESAKPSRAAKIRKEQTRLRTRRREVYASALVKFRQLVAMEYPAPDALLNLADLELVTMQDEAAAGHYEDYLVLCRTSISRWRNMRDNPAEFQVGEKAAEQIILESNKQIASATKKAVDVLEKLASMQFKAAHHQKAATLLEEALQLDPSRVGLRVSLAECLAPLGRISAAVRHLEVFLRDSSPFDARKKKAVQMRAALLAKAGKSESRG